MEEKISFKDLNLIPELEKAIEKQGYKIVLAKLQYGLFFTIRKISN